MPIKSDKEIVFFLTNVGKQPADGDSDYVGKAKEVMKLITEKKIFLRPKDEVGIMLVGQKDNDFQTNQDPFLKSLGTPSLTTLLQKNQVPSWEIVEKILDIEKSNKHFKDWPKALAEVLEELKKTAMDCRVILILLFDCDVYCPDIKNLDSRALATQLREMNIQLLWIGSKLLKDMPSEKLNESEKVLTKILDMCNGEYMTIEKTLPSLRIFKKHKARFIAWRCCLEIGKIMIPTSTYVQAVEDEKRPVFRTVNTLIENNTEKKITVSAERDYVDRHREAHPLSETIPGYMYGRKFIPVSEADEIGMHNPSAVKSLIIFGFVPHDSINLEDITSDSTRIVVPDGPLAEKAFYCLVQAMHKTKHLGIVRKVYRAKSEPKMGLLVPRTDVPGEPWCLVYLELLFAEDRRIVATQPINSIIKGLTKEKEDIVEDLIDSMMLTDKDDKGDELFAPGTVPSPSTQHLWNSLSIRALNPHASLEPMDENLKKLLESPVSIKIKSEPLMKKIKELFGIEKTNEPSTVPQDTTVQPAIPVISEIKKMESKIEECMNELISGPEESCVDLDELFDADMDM